MYRARSTSPHFSKTLEAPTGPSRRPQPHPSAQCTPPKASGGLHRGNLTRLIRVTATNPTAGNSARRYSRTIAVPEDPASWIIGSHTNLIALGQLRVVGLAVTHRPCTSICGAAGKVVLGRVTVATRWSLYLYICLQRCTTGCVWLGGAI
jgi:hypothetical protein